MDVANALHPPHRPPRLLRRAACALAALVGVTACTDDGAVTAPVFPEPRHSALPLHSTVADLLGLGLGPVAIAHRGMGANVGEDPDRPIENTLEAVMRAYGLGASVVELDLQLTADGEVVTWHDDFLDDFTCIRSLTRAQLEARAPHIPSFQAVLQTAKRFNRTSPEGLSGLLTVDLKPASPLCDPADATGADLVTAAVDVVRRMGASELIYFNSMSPVLLGLAAAEAPDIPRQLTVLLLQLLSPEQVEVALGLPVTIIEKEPSYGLRWAEIGQLFRLPGYDDPEQALATAFAVQAGIVSWDLDLLGYMEQAQPGAAAQLVQATQAAGIHVFSGDVDDAGEWFFGAALGIEALYANDVPLALSLQPPLP